VTADADPLRTAALAEEIAAPETHAHLLELIVETAASVISARAAALFLIDEQAGDLVFQVALGGSADAVEDVRIPLGHGIAGGVALSGMPLAVSKASSDPRWAKDVGERVGYAPETIACVPLYLGDRIVGALELLDKEGGASFTPTDLHTLGLFANLAAVAIEQSRNRLAVRALALDGADSGFGAELELAQLVREIAQAGESELATCRELVGAFAAYLRTRRR
jgi:GAF domain-containing protein